MRHVMALAASDAGTPSTVRFIVAACLVVLTVLSAPCAGRAQTPTTIPGVQGIAIPTFYELNQQAIIDATNGAYLQVITSFTDVLQDNNFNPELLPGFDAPDNFSNLYTPEAKAALVSAGSLALFQWTITADNRLSGRRVGDLALYKFIPAGINYDNRPDSGYVRFSMVTATAGVTGVNGQAWLTTQADPNTVLGPDAVLALNGTYILWAVIQDDGVYDLDDADGLIVDPPTLSTAPDNGDDDGGDSGCVLRGRGDFGPEWLLLLAGGGLLTWRGVRRRRT